MAIAETIICKEVGALYEDLLKKNPGTSTQETSADVFKASFRWFDYFKKRTDVRKSEF